jgi:hypothetical protein
MKAKQRPKQLFVMWHQIFRKCENHQSVLGCIVFEQKRIPSAGGTQQRQ